MVNWLSRSKALSLFFASVMAVGCGTGADGSLQLTLVLADRDAHQSILVDPEFIELEILVEGDAIGVPMRNTFFANSRTATIPNIPVGNNYRVSVFGIAEGDDGRSEPHFFGRSGAFDMAAGEDKRVPIQIGRTNCIGLNRSTNLSGLLGGSYDMLEPRDGFATAALADGRVLIIGGGQVDQLREVAEPTVTIEVFDPLTHEIRPSEFRLNTPRAYHTATTLLDGTVLVYGGISAVGGQVSTTAELIIPSESPIVVPLSIEPGTSRYQHEAMRLDRDGSVLIVGGYDESGNLSDSVFRYFPLQRTFLPQGGLSSPRASGALSATRLSGYPAAYSGGVTLDALARTVELFSTRADQGNVETGSPACNDGGAASEERGCFVNYQQMEIARSHHQMLTAYAGTELLILGGYTNVPKSTVTDRIERFRRDAQRGTVVEQLGQLPFGGGELGAGQVPEVSGGRGAIRSYLVAGGFTGTSLNNGAAQIKESEWNAEEPGRYEITSLPLECNLPEPRANLKIIDTGNQSLLLLGGHRYDGRWVSTKRVEVYFPEFQAALFQ